MPALKDDSEGSRLEWRRSPQRWRKERDLESEGEPGDGIEWLQSHDQTWRDEELFLMDEQRTWFLEMECSPGEDALKIVETTTRD